MRTIVHSRLFPATPDTLYQIFASPDRHGELLGSKVWISRRPGGRFSAQDGRFWGEILRVVPGRSIVMTWRSVAWGPRERDSILVLTFERAKGGARLHLVHANVPDRHAEAVREDWVETYLDPLREYLQRRSPEERRRDARRLVGIDDLRGARSEGLRTTLAQ